GQRRSRRSSSQWASCPSNISSIGTSSHHASRPHARTHCFTVVWCACVCVCVHVCACVCVCVSSRHTSGFLASDTKIMELKDERVKKITEILHVQSSSDFSPRGVLYIDSNAAHRARTTAHARRTR